MTLAETSRFCVKGIRDRLLRSSLTLAVVTLAVAFFMFLLSENAFVAAMSQGVTQEIASRRLATRTLNEIYNAPSSLVLGRRLSDAWRRDHARLEEYAAVTSVARESIEQMAQTAALEQDYLVFFADMPIGKRLVLVEEWEGRDIFRFLAGPERQRVFAERIKPMTDLQVPGGAETFFTFLAGFPAYLGELNELASRWRGAAKDITEATRALTKGRSVEAWLAEATPAQLDAWRVAVTGSGFRLSADILPTLQAQLRTANRRAAVARMLNSAKVRAEWRRVFRERRRTSVDEKLLRLGDPRAVTVLGNRYDQAELVEVAEAVSREQRLSRLQAKLLQAGAAQDAGHRVSPRQAFLVLISFMVCMVGIANAMLMSITERFREIATMKCLGATDHYILTQFMMEAALQGVAGGLLGLILGFVIAVAKNLANLGGTLLTCWPGMGLAWGGAISLGVGVLLAMLASLYPSLAASRMLPMEAMRVE